MSGFIHYDYVEIFESGLRGSDMLLYFRLAIAGGAEKRCSVSVPKLAQWLKSTPQWIRGAVKRLEEAGFIRVERSVGGSGRTNTYYITDRKGKSKSGDGSRSVKSTSVESTRVDEKRVVRNENPVDKTSKTLNVRFPIKNNINNPSQRIREKECAGAPDFFKEYPLEESGLVKLFPFMPENYARDYIFNRMADHWRREDGSRVELSQIPDDFIEWSRQREIDLQQEITPPPEDDFSIWDLLK